MDIFVEFMLKHSKVFNVTFAVLLTIFFYLLGVLFLGRLVRKAVQTQGRHWHRKDVEKRQATLAALFTTVWRVLVITVGAFYVVNQLIPGIDFAPLFASAGVVGVAIGFGAQSLVRDFLSGIFIISENQYRVGDIVEIEGFGGVVERIGARSTVLRDADGQVHYFPNGMVQHVINKTMGYSMARFFIGVHPSSDIDAVIRLINKTGEKLAKEEKWKQKIIEAPNFVSIGDFTSTEVTLWIAGKVQPADQWSVTAEMRRRLLLEFEKNDIQLGASFPALQGAPK
jgi:small-conductance mechanosensitive channel